MPRTPLQKILAQCRASSQTEREKGSYFEELIRTYFRYEDAVPTGLLYRTFFTSEFAV